MLWILLAGIAAVLGYGLWSLRRRWGERRRAAEERLASFVAQAKPPAAPTDASGLGQQTLLLEAAAKAAEAGEPLLSIQLCARLIARYPDGALASRARASVELQRKKLAKTQSSG